METSPLEDLWIDGHCSYRDLWMCALLGDPTAVPLLVRATGGQVASLMREAQSLNMRNPAYRDLLTAAWRRNSRGVVEAATDRDTLRDWFGRAGFDTMHLPETMKLYRGVKLPPPAPWQQAACGYSWTADLETAAAFASEGVIWTKPECTTPTVVSANIPRCFVWAAFPDDFSEHVVIAPDDEMLIGSLDRLSIEGIKPRCRQGGRWLD